MKYKITIEAKTPYKEKVSKYEATDGKRYVSTYSVPEKMEYKEVYIETGKILYTSEDIYMQEMEELDVEAVIKAVNVI